VSRPRDWNLLTVNEGSSSVKIATYRMGELETRELVADVERIGSPLSRITIEKDGIVFNDGDRFTNHGAALTAVLRSIQDRGWSADFDGVGHRAVLGDSRFVAPQRLDDALLSTLKELADRAPDHIPQLIDSIQSVTQLYPGVPQVICSDSSFHNRMPAIAKMFGLPRRFLEAGVRRYGFHGLSCEYIMQELNKLDPEAARGRIVIAHLGNGSSMTAVHHGNSIDTSMGFTPMAGLVMGSRCGDQDPGALLYLMTHERMSAQELNSLLNKDSGLLGVSGSSADMRDLLARESTDPHSADAIALFCYQARKLIGAYSAALGGLDSLVFTGGIGEHGADIRARICDGLGFLGITLNDAANAAHASIVSGAGGAVAVRVIHTNEDLMIARHTRRVLAQN
jgi:acetate kinase